MAPKNNSLVHNSYNNTNNNNTTNNNNWSYVLRDNKPGFVLSLFLIFFNQNQGFCSYKIVLTKKECRRFRKNN